MCSVDLALNNLKCLICHKTKPNETQPNQTKPKPLKNQRHKIYICIHRITLNGKPSRQKMQNTPTTPLHRGKTFPNVCAKYDTKPSDGKATLPKP